MYVHVRLVSVLRRCAQDSGVICRPEERQLLGLLVLVGACCTYYSTLSPIYQSDLHSILSLSLFSVSATNSSGMVSFLQHAQIGQDQNHWT